MTAPESERIRIDPEEVARAVPPPPPHLYASRQAVPRVEAPPRVDRLAVGALVLSLLGIPLVGCLMGPIAIICGALALSRLYGREDVRGSGMALAGLLLGAVEFVGWMGVLFWSLATPSAIRPQPTPPPSVLNSNAQGLADAPLHIRKALLANVRLTCSGGESILGSGINVASGDGRTLLLTNRHVADCGQGAALRVAFHDGEDVEGRVLWLGPDGVDLAVVEARSGHERRSEVMPLNARHAARVGDGVFAVGNPLGYDTTYTVGVLSAVRRVPMGPLEGRVYQVQAGINPGNSGGGLYTSAGGLIGINTWAVERTRSEGLGFAISVDTIAEALRGADASLRGLVPTSSEEGSSR
ncbi:trypsin-like peptidase domain-containing protein [Pyxidicoccus parkwayensis]|uniref:Trypsin-like peptidase domain-containing protein n=1 Tax=Pyxidicoccus parkwayensis TaxID=2813578 RepID=A0ABX7NQQ8_9BACT|nr:trypsin-like peptidase domain-containing protein [Pyxidicoccus parkwaysis]QSQ20736.1 trypsin-like peptidase domain-containing protein [Pyxidicoccus parkwaysis]